MSQHSPIFGLVAAVSLPAQAGGLSKAQQAREPRPLVFSLTAGFRHSSIEVDVSQR
jgi:hypothetical protein